ncbi:MAG: hypothetical protein KDJ52_18835 [Anaerolineae bacterium]|nr:hypothetical protein [Anaerolineae bacterium]
MEYIINIAFVILSINVLIVASVWYASTLIKPIFPNLWKQYFVDEDPYYRKM